MPEPETIDESAHYDEKHLIKMWRAWKTANEMLADRGYEISEDDTRITLDDFRVLFTHVDGSINYDRLHIAAPASEDMLKKLACPPSASQRWHIDDPIWLEFLLDMPNCLDGIREFHRRITDSNFKRGIIVTNWAPSPQARQYLLEVVKRDVRVECFLVEQLVVNITHHELVPKHILLSYEEKAAVLKKYHISERQLPCIQKSDPVARYMGLQGGQVVRIIRTSPFGDRYVVYRLCI